MKTLDATGLKCPMPLIETKKALKEINKDEALRIIIDNETSVKNVEHFLRIMVWIFQKPKRMEYMKLL